MLLAAALLRRGDDIASVAAETGVPAALLELVGREVDPGITPLVLPPVAVLRRRSAAVAVWMFGLAATANVVACVGAFLRHRPAFGLFTAVVAVLLTAGIQLLGRAAAPVRATSRSRMHPPSREAP